MLLEKDGKRKLLTIKILRYEKEYFQVGRTLHQSVEFGLVVQDDALAGRQHHVDSDPRRSRAGHVMQRYSEKSQALIFFSFGV